MKHNCRNLYEIFDQLKNKDLHKEIIKATIKSVIKNASINRDNISSENKAKETFPDTRLPAMGSQPCKRGGRSRQGIRRGRVDEPHELAPVQVGQPRAGRCKGCVPGT